jgi:hypothetical protein
MYMIAASHICVRTFWLDSIFSVGEHIVASPGLYSPLTHSRPRSLDAVRHLPPHISFHLWFLYPSTSSPSQVEPLVPRIELNLERHQDR